MLNLIKTSQTAWPVGITTSKCIKGFVETFFQLLDSGTSEGAKQWSELWIPTTGEFHAFGIIYKGREEIKGYLLDCHKNLPGLDHSPKKVYFNSADGMDLTIITSYKFTSPNGKYVSGESAALFEFEEQDSKVSVRVCRLIIDPNPLLSEFVAAVAAHE
ncbi:hypothetical protein BJX99DRAFT_259401 [Aspergillus californicus]